jgi:hypothetical protein
MNAPAKGAAAFMLRYQEPVVRDGSFGAYIGTETFTRTPKEQNDNDRHTGMLMAIPRTKCLALRWPNASDPDKQ